jgi:CRP/FNR family transcriptional regulator
MLPSNLDCAQRPDRIFGDLGPDVLAEFDGIKSRQTFPRGAALFREGQSARGIYLLTEGRVRLTVCSESGRRMTLRTVGPGQILGLSAALAGGFYEITAEAVDNVEAAEIRRKDLLHFLHEHCDICMQVVNLLSENLHEAYERVRAVGLTRVRHPHSHTAQHN